MISMRYLILASLAGLAAAPVALANPTQAVPLTAPAADGPDKEVKELVDTPFVKLVSITLRKGTVLPDHAAPMAVTLQATTGAGSVKVGDEVMPIGGDRLVVLAPNAVHSVTPAGQETLVVLVHYLKGAGPHAGHHGAGHGCEGGKCGCEGGKCADGKCADGKCACEGGKCADGKCADGKCACEGGKCAGGHCADGKCACEGGKCADGKCACADGKCAGGHCADGKCACADGKCAGGHCADGKCACADGKCACAEGECKCGHGSKGAEGKATP